MASISNVICIFVIIFSTSQLSNAKQKTEWKTHRLISKDGWSRTSEQFDNPTFVYALCKDEPLLNSKHECMIVLHKDVHDSTEKPTQCMFTLENASNGITRIENFGTDRAIIVRADETTKNKTLQWTFNMAVIQMSNCQIVDTGLVLTTKTSGFGDKIWFAMHNDILVYEDKFDVVIQGIQACGDAIDDSHCVYTYNSDGKQIGGPITRFSPHCDEEYYQLRPISRRSSEKGYLVNVMKKTLRVFIIKPTGKLNNEVTTNLLWKFTTDQKGHSKPSFSCNNEIIGMCSCKVLSDKISCTCLQSDQEGNSKRQMEIAVRKSSDAIPATIFMYNLREGGFFFIPFYTDNKKHFYSMSKVNADGRVVGEPIVIGSHARTCSPKFINTRFTEQDDGQYCITLACMDKSRVENILETLTKCYNPSSLDWKFHAKDHFEL